MVAPTGPEPPSGWRQGGAQGQAAAVCVWKGPGRAQGTRAGGAAARQQKEQLGHGKGRTGISKRLH